MKNFFLYLFILCSTIAIAAKREMPDWMDPQRREMLYPAEKYYTGFASATVNKGEDKSSVYERVQQNARVTAVSAIQVSVEQTVERFIKNTQAHGDAYTVDIMASHAKTHAGIKDIPGLNVDTWENPKTGDICAFAWVKISDLTKRLMRRIASNTAKIEVELQAIESMIERGDKVQARDNLAKLQNLLDDIENDQRIMLSVDADVTDEDMAVEDVTRLKKQYQALSASLKNGINIYLDCKADLFGSSYYALKGEIQGALSPIGCTFVRSASEADWVVSISAQAREYNKNDFGSVSSYFAYVDANIAIDKNATGQRIYEDAISMKGGHTHNFEQAARDAYKQISPKISKIINEQIQQ